MNVTFRQLRVFVEVARQGSVLRASEVLHLTPPAVSLQIKEIESQVGQRLFDRANRRITLSTAGEYFLVYARRLLGTLKEAEDAMARFARLESGRLTIGMVSTAKYFLPQLLARFHTEHPAGAPAPASHDEPEADQHGDLLLGAVRNRPRAHARRCRNTWTSTA